MSKEKLWKIVDTHPFSQPAIGPPGFTAEAGGCPKLSPGLTSRAVIEKMTAIQMIDVHLPTTDGRMLILSRYTQPEPDHQLLLQRLHLTLPAQPPPKISQQGENDATKPIAL